MEHHRLPHIHGKSGSTASAYYGPHTTDTSRKPRDAIAMGVASDMRDHQLSNTCGNIDCTAGNKEAQHASHRLPHKNNCFNDTSRNSIVANATAAASHGGDDGEKSLGFHIGSMAYSRAMPGASQGGFSPPAADPVVQTNNRLTEDYSRRIHCYISGDQNSDSIPNEHMPPPVLPPLQSFRHDQEMPFWRPPRVLQQDPHYNRGYSPTPALSNIRRSPYAPYNTHLRSAQTEAADEPGTYTAGKSQLETATPFWFSHVPAKRGLEDEPKPQASSRNHNPSTRKALVCRESKDSHSYDTDYPVSQSMTFDKTSSLLSPALLAISNSHYEQQRRQHRQSRQDGYITRMDSHIDARKSPDDATVLAAQRGIESDNILDGNNGNGSILPPIHTLTERVSVSHPTANIEPASRDQNKLYTQASNGHIYKRMKEEPREPFCTSGHEKKELGATRADGFDTHLPLIRAKHKESSDKLSLLEMPSSTVDCANPAVSQGSVSSPGLGTSAIGGTRESISIAYLVDHQRPTTPAQVCSTEKCRHRNTASSTSNGLVIADPSCGIAPPSYSSTSAQSLADYGSSGAPLASGVSELELRKRSYGAADAALSLHKLARAEPESILGRGTKPPECGDSTTIGTLSAGTSLKQPLCAGNEVVITCYHASVAQKSYGGEKRFLCPPPAVLLCGEGYSAEIAHHSPMLLSVTPDTEAHRRLYPSQSTPRIGANELNQQEGTLHTDSSNSGSGNSIRPSSSSHGPLECQTSFNERNVALFKSLHVTGMQKAKSFRLRLDLLIPTTVGIQLYPHDGDRWHAPDVYASLESDPVAIISKPSKKTAKARNQSSCIRAGSLISLFNRINSQTFRTKYLNVDHNTNRWVAQSHNWSPLEVIVLSDNGGGGDEASCNSRDCDQSRPAEKSPLFYGSEIVLVESRRNFQSPPMIIHKVERGRLVKNAKSPVSQMQKIALQLKPSTCSPARFLKADVGHYSPVAAESGANMHFDDPDGSPELTFEVLENARISRARARDVRDDDGGAEIDDAFCWTIVGISGFTHSYSIPSERPVPLRYIGPIPRVIDVSIVRGDKLVMRALNFDAAQMQLLLNKKALCACTFLEDFPPTWNNSVVEQQQNHRQATKGAALTRSGALAKRPETGLVGESESRMVYAFQLPSDAQPGSLSVRRADGVLYHAQWEIKLNPTSNGYETAVCNLDI